MVLLLPVLHGGDSSLRRRVRRSHEIIKIGSDDSYKKLEKISICLRLGKRYTGNPERNDRVYNPEK